MSNLVSFLTPVRATPEKFVNNASIMDNKGLIGLDKMISSVYEMSTHKSTGEFKFDIILKIDDDDTEMINHVTEKYEACDYVNWIITKRNSKNPNAHYEIIHLWLDQCFSISKPSKYYWLWNHSNRIISERWDEFLYENMVVETPLHPAHPDRPGGNLFPIVSDFLVNKHGTVCGSSPFDLYWQQLYKLGHKFPQIVLEC